ncbi:Gfo/Idh/MocA family protein [Enterococcus sp. LJL98]
MRIKYGIVSAATIVPRFVEGIRASQTGEVVAIAARTLEKAQQMASKLQIPQAYGSYGELFADETIDIIYVANYNQGHYAVAKEALLAGKAVLVEKPFTLTLDEVEELFAIAQAQGLFLMEAQKSLFLPITERVKTWLAAGDIGEVKYLDCRISHTNADQIPWFQSFEAGGGALYGSGSYPIEYFQSITGEKIEEVAGTAVMDPHQSDRQCDVTILFSSGFQGHFVISTLFPSPSVLTIYGTQGQIEIPDFWKAETATITMNGESEQICLPHQSEFVFEINHVNECLAQGLTASPIVSPDLTMQAVELIEKMYEQWTSDW